MHIMMAVLMVLAATVHDVGAQQAEYPPGGSIDPFLLREDLSIFRMTLEEAHPGLYRYTTKSVLDALYEEIEEALTRPLSQHEFYLLLHSVIAAIADGHTKFHPDDVWAGFAYVNRDRQLPLQLYVVDDRGWIAWSLDHDSLPPGAELLAIDGVPIAKVLAELYA